MAHVSNKPVFGRFFATGVPGVGFQTLCDQFKFVYTDDFGYRGSPHLPEEWLISLDRFGYLLFDTDLSSNVLMGYGSNYLHAGAMARNVILITVSYDLLFKRVDSYRVEQKIEDGKSSATVAKMLWDLQHQMTSDLKSMPGLNLFVVGGDASSDVVGGKILSIVSRHIRHTRVRK